VVDTAENRGFARLEAGFERFGEPRERLFSEESAARGALDGLSNGVRLVFVGDLDIAARVVESVRDEEGGEKGRKTIELESVTQLSNKILLPAFSRWGLKTILM